MHSADGRNIVTAGRERLIVGEWRHAVALLIIIKSLLPRENPYGAIRPENTVSESAELLVPETATPMAF